MKIFIVAGEASGDILGARLMAALRMRSPNISFAGVGGTEMQAQGLNSLFPMQDLSVMGLAEVLPKLPVLMKRIHETADQALAFNPDVLVTIDSPDFSFRVVRRLKKAKPDFPCLHYVAPSVWAWRPARAAKVARFLDHLLTLLPFEPPYFEKYGLSSTFIGHPVVEKKIDIDADYFYERYGIDKSSTVISVLPGSRRGEVKKLSPVFAQTMRKVLQDKPDISIVIPTFPHLRETISAAFEAEKLKVFFVDQSEKENAFAVSKAALAASGTVSLELAAQNVPHMIAYKLNPITTFVVKFLVKTKFANLINIILQKEVVPEMLLKLCHPENLAKTLLNIVNDHDVAQKQKDSFEECLQVLGRGAEISPSEKAADVVFSLAQRESINL